MVKEFVFRRAIKLIFLLYLVIFQVASLLAQATATASIEPERIETGDTFRLRVLVSGTGVEPGQVDFGPWTGQLPAKNILRHSGWHRTGAQWVQNFTLITFDSATLDLPPLNVRLHLGETVQTNPLRLNVVPTAAEADINTMAAIRDIDRSPIQWTNYWPWALAAAILLILVRRFLRPKKAKPIPVIVAAPAPAPAPVHAEALRKITLLEQKRLWEKDQIKEHYAELSLIVREYLEKRYHIAALESTTTEIEKLLKTTEFPKELNLAIKDLLAKADLAKYAQSSPPAAFHEKSIEKARAMIQETKGA